MFPLQICLLACLFALQFLTPQTVDAYFHPNLNEIAFPAAILQSPFFDPNADDAVNYGSMGAVVGHEMTHGYGTHIMLCTVISCARR